MEHIVELAEENMNMPAWKYNDKCYLKLMEKAHRRVIGQSHENPGGDVEQIEFNKDAPYIMGLYVYRF